MLLTAASLTRAARSAQSLKARVLRSSSMRSRTAYDTPTAQASKKLVVGAGVDVDHPRDRRRSVSRARTGVVSGFVRLSR